MKKLLGTAFFVIGTICIFIACHYVINPDMIVYFVFNSASATVLITIFGGIFNLLCGMYIIARMKGEEKKQSDLLEDADEDMLEKYRNVEAVVTVTALFRDGKMFDFYVGENCTKTSEYTPDPKSK